MYVQVNEYPWMTGIGTKGSLSPSCGGALVSDQYVLTAAHCCHGRSAASLQVFLGDHDWTVSTETDSFRRSALAVRYSTYSLSLLTTLILR